MTPEPRLRDTWSEDLIWQARRGLELGRELCTCEGHYHTVWGALRAAGITGSLKSEEPLLASLIAPYFRPGTRVMIGGAADPGVPCAIGRIGASSRPQLTVIDRCRSPLALMREFAASKGLSCRTLNQDLATLDGSQQWDQIVLHYTPDFVQRRQRKDFFRSLARSLAPQGVLVCALMTGTEVGTERRGDLVSAFLGYSFKALENSALADLRTTPGFEDMIRGYAAGLTSRRLDLPTSDELSRLLSDLGLRILSENATPRRQRFFESAAVIDSSTIIIATPD